MPAPGGKHKGSESSSRGYAGSGSGEGGKGGAQSGGGKMGASSSQSGGVKSSGGGKMGASSSQSGGVRGGNATGSSMGSRSANAATGAKGYGGGPTSSNSGGPSAASRGAHAAAMASTRSQGSTLGGGLKSVTPAAANNRTANTLAAAQATGLVPTPRTHPFRDPSRFRYAGSVPGPDALANALPTSGLSRLANLQSAYGKPMTITSGYRSPAYNAQVGGALKSQHMAHKAVDIGVPSADRARVAQLAKDMGFAGIGTYGGPFQSNMVHVDVRDNPATWGGVAKRALGGYQPSEPDMAAIAAGMQTPTFGRPANQSMPALASTFPGRPAPQAQFNSMVAARPEQVGLGFPAAFRSDFLARPQPAPGFASQVASRPSLPNGFMSQIAGRPEQVGSGFPAAQPQQMTAAAPQPQSPGLWGAPNPPRSFANIPQGGLLAARDSGLLSALMGATGIGVGRDNSRQGGDGTRLGGRAKPKKKETASPPEPDNLPWETGAQPFGFTPPQMAQRSMPPWLWGAWS